LLVPAAVAALSLLLPPSAGAANDCPSPGQTCNDLNVVAHEDDDLLFMSPPLRASIDDKRHFVRTIYLTAGDVAEGSSTDRWSRREAGIRAAYAEMAGVANAWAESTPAPGMHQYTLVGAPRVSLVFMRLYEAYGGDFLGRLWRREIAEISDIFGPSDASGTNQKFTRQGLIDALTGEYARFKAHRINAMDSSLTLEGSHADHVAAALFALAAKAAYTPDHAFVIHRDYNISAAPRNVWGPDYVSKEHVFFDLYAPQDPADPGAGRNAGEADAYAAWQHRHYSFRSVAPRNAAIGGAADRCLVSDRSSVGSQLRLGECTEAPQRWAIEAKGQLRTPKGACIGTAGASDLVQLVNCGTVARKNSFLMTNGQIRIGEAECVGTGALTDDGAPARAETCQDVATQRWFPQSDPPTDRSTTADFSDAALGDPSRWDSLGLADVNGDGNADACARRAEGVWCSANDGAGSFGAATLWTSEFSDAAGWSAPQYGRTIQLGDVSGDGRADVCGRDDAGVVCAVANPAGTAFATPRLWTSSFGDAAEYEESETYYLTFALADVNGDRFADACSRAGDGIRCALNDRAGSLGSAIRMTDEFSDSNGWDADVYGSTVVFGDVNGDGRSDVCGRGGINIVCAVATWADPVQEPAFAFPFTLFSGAVTGFDPTGWSEPAQHRSIQIADVNGDSYGDICGRDAAGLRCAIARPYASYLLDPFRYLPRSFAAPVWQAEAHGASLRFADVNGDGRADACWRSDLGLTCANN
jgi:hypothetical protein